jgi:GrpB-like predicted nucleotidyltransferase (UPF0157 family)
MALELPKGTVRVVSYSPEWQRVFQEERDQIQVAIGDYVLEIRHIGSTSVPGLAAKPIIDIGVAVESFEEAIRCIEPLVSLGYEYRGENGIPRRHYFIRTDPIEYHLHMNEIHSWDWIQTTRFRDYLAQHPYAALAYAALKEQLAQQHPTDILAYQAGKNTFIEGVLREALAESDEPG